jgi:2-keto-4-pentenoate hydratase/2-oxohepta-3-ene-1,7-dioic acid hydratase in catechol pathway
VPRPSKIVAIGLNYRSHAEEVGAEIPEEPLVFAKFPSSLAGPGATVAWEESTSRRVDYEAELVAVIGRRGRHVSLAAGLDHVFGYTCGNDVSARDLQRRDGQWTRAKSLDGFSPVGPWVLSADEVPDPQALRLRCEVNDEIVQEQATADMIFGVAELVSRVSSWCTLEPGDLIFTGTPAGIGAARDPRRFLADGDRVAIEITGMGRLENTCAVTAPSERSRDGD